MSNIQYSFFFILIITSVIFVSILIEVEAIKQYEIIAHITIINPSDNIPDKPSPKISKNSGGGHGRINVPMNEMPYHKNTSGTQVNDYVMVWGKNNLNQWINGYSSEYALYIVIDVLGNSGLLDLPEKTIKNYPQWFENNVSWFVDSQISNDEFLKTLQYLLDRKIITI